MKFLKSLIYCVAMGALVLLGSCSDDGPDGGGAGSSKGDVKFVLHVGISAPNYDTRAEGDYPYEFEDVSTAYEGINTLRVIIVDSQNKVERDSLFTFADRVPVNGDTYGPMVFNVRGAEKKMVYLIANEASITPQINFDTKYAAGRPLPPSEARSWQLYNEWPEGAGARAVPLVDNTGNAKKYVPLTEFFEVDIKNKNSEGGAEQDALFFLTRSLVKFSFYINTEKSGAMEQNFRIKEMEFTNVMQKSYLLPNNTTYVPAKYPLTGDLKRLITEFTTPGYSNNALLPISFKPTSFGFSADGEEVNGHAVSVQYSPELYFCETQNNDPDNSFSLKCTVEWQNNEPGTDTEYITTFESVKLPNLPIFPRNTHVKVYLSFVDRQISAQVILMPYIGVWLDPIFGIGGDLGPTNITPEN